MLERWKNDAFILSKRPAGAFGMLTTTIQGFDLAMYLSDTSLAYCCCPGGKKSASYSNMNLELVRERIASR